jgi:CubicO group peptidase (beta-lactamase class C family)
MPANRSSTSAPSRRWLRESTPASPTGAGRLIREIRKRRSAAVAAALIVSAALSLFLTGCDHHPKTAVRGDHRMFVMDDFESGALTGWRAVGGGSGGWFVYTEGSKAPDPAQSDPNVPFDLPNPPQGKFAAVTDTNGPGTRILYRDVELDGRLRLQLSVFYAGVGGFSSPQSLAYDEPGVNEQFRIDLVAPSAPIDSVAHGDVLVSVFKTSAGDPDRREPSAVSVDLSRWAGRTVRLRLAATDNSGPLRAGVDDIRFEPIGANANARIELPDTKEPARAVNLVLHRMTEADALGALSARADKLAGEDELSGAVLVAKGGRVLFKHAYGLADRKRRIPNTIRTRFRIGSMNKMFTAVAILQLVEAGKVKLTAPLGTYLPDYPSRDVATKVTIHQLLTHTGGTGDIFGPDFDAHRNELRTLADYVKLYGKRGLEFKPGSRWAYSNYGFILLGAVIEKVTGQSYYDYVQQHVYAPAGMTRSGSLPEDQAVPDRSIGYTKPPGTTAWVPNTDTLPYRATSAGGGYSTVEDLARYAHALLSHKLLNPDSTKLLITGKVKAGPGARYAYGFEDARNADGNGWVGHGGGAPGMNGDLKIYPKSGYMVAVLANIDPPAAQRISEYLDPRLPTQR